MPSPLLRRTKATPKAPRPAKRPGTWKLEDAKARLSEVVRLAGTAGPQLVTVRGKEAAVILAPDQYRRLLPKPSGHQPLVQFLKSLHLATLNVERETDTGREIDL